MLLSGSPVGRIRSAYAEQILIEISAAFRHSFSLLHEKIGEESRQSYGETLTQETVDAMENCDGILLLSGSNEDAEALYDALELPIRIRSYCVPAALCGRHEKPVSLYVATVLSNDAETLKNAAHSVFQFARNADAPLAFIPANGAAKALWMETMEGMRSEYPDISLHTMQASEAVTGEILSPWNMGVLLCPPYAGGILSAAADALCAYPGLIHDASFYGRRGVYCASPISTETTEETALNPFSSVCAAADLLRYSLHLEQEAACVEAAVNNVLLSGWRTEGMQPSGHELTDPEKIVELICEQISVAGELMNKGSF